jgi:branched-chain amino acid transport system substrate-binding protein
MGQRMRRRDLLHGSLALAGAAAAGALWPAGGGTARAEGPIKIGLIIPLTGVFAPNGRDMANGLSLALAQAGNRAAGREIQVLTEDDQGVPAQTLTKARKLVELEKVDLLAGPLTANSGYALRDYVDEQKVPTVYPVVSSDDLTQRKGSPWLVRTGWASSQINHPFGEYAARTLRYRRIVTIAYDFAFGWETVEGFQDTFEQNGGRVTEHLWPPIGAPDYSPYLGRIPRDVDAVYATFSGGDALRFLQQWRAFGLEGRLPLIGNGTLTDEHILFQENDLARGIVTALHYSAALNTQANRDFVRAYVRAYNRVPSYYSENSYTAGLFILTGLEAVGGRIEDRAAFVAAVRKVVLPNAPRGPVRLDPWGNPIQNVYVRRVDLVGGEPQNTVVSTYPHVSQFWTWSPAEYLKRPVYTRDLPPAHP